MTYEIESIDYKDYRISIIADEDPINPREDFDCFGKMICFHSRYNLGDYKLVDRKSSDEFLYYLLIDLINNDDERDELDTNYEHMGHNDFIDHAISKLENYAVVIDLYLYDHSGITMNTTGFSCPWDSGKIGFTYVTFEDIIKEYGELTDETKEKARKLLISEVETYDKYLTGDICAFKIYDKEDEEIDSCYGFYDKDYCIQEAKSSVDWYSNNKQKRLEKESLIMTA